MMVATVRQTATRVSAVNTLNGTRNCVLVSINNYNLRLSATFIDHINRQSFIILLRDEIWFIVIIVKLQWARSFGVSWTQAKWSSLVWLTSVLRRDFL